jgi:nicotinamide riboside transporter PnuC
VDPFSYLSVLISIVLALGMTREGAADESINYKTHFYANHRAFFIILALYGPVDVLDSLLKGVRHFLDLGPPYMISITFFLTGVTTAAITRNERYHEFYALFFLTQTVVISFAVFRTLV